MHEIFMSGCMSVAKTVFNSEITEQCRKFCKFRRTRDRRGKYDELNICRVRFEVFTAVTMKNAVSWDVAPCISCELNRRFGGRIVSNFRVEKSASGEPA
jgi:hypothetical protein